MKTRFWFRKCQTNQSTNTGILYGYVIVNSVRSKEFSTGISIKKKFWDSKNQKIKSNAILNQELENLKNLLLKAKQKLEFEKPDFSANDVLDLVIFKKVTVKETTFLEQWYNYKELCQIQENWSKNTIRNHNSMFHVFSKFLQEKQIEKIYPCDLNKKILYDFFVWRKKGQTTFARFVSIIQKVLRYCIENEYIREHKLLFYKVKREEKIDKTHLSLAELQKFECFESEKEHLNKTKDIFLFLCYTGLNISDYLKFSENPKKYIQGEFIVISREKTEKKTNQKAYIPISSKLKNLLEKWNLDLPKLKNPQNINKNLKEIGKILGIEAKKMRTKIGRKTFAHFWLNSNVDKKAVSKMLGHAKTTTLEQYYADVDFDFVKSEILKNAPEI